MRLLRLPQVVEMTGLSRMTIYRLEVAGRFPARRRVSPNSVAWLDEDLYEWMRAKSVANPKDLSAVGMLHDDGTRKQV